MNRREDYGDDYEGEYPLDPRMDVQDEIDEMRGMMFAAVFVLICGVLVGGVAFLLVAKWFGVY